MAIETTPLGLKAPDGNELARNGDNVIGDNARKTQELIAADRGRLSAIESKNTAQDNRLTAVESKNTAQDNRLTAAETAAASLYNRVSSTENKNATQDNTLTSHGARLTNAETAATTLTGRVTAVEGKNTQQDTRLTAIDTKNAAQDTTLANHKSRVESLEALGGLAPGDVSDATVTDLIANPETTTANALAGKFVGKGDLAYSVKDYASPAAAVAAAFADGATLNWPAGDYATTESIPNLHKVRHTGPGRIVRGSDVFTVAPRYATANKLYAAADGLSTNDGLSAAQPMNRLSTVFSALNNYGPVLQGNWQAHLAAGTYNDQAITGQQSLNRIQVYGAPVTAGTAPTTIFTPGATGFTKAIGASDFVKIGLTNIAAQGYTTAESPAFDFTAHCNVNLTNVWASGGDIGFRFMNHTKYAIAGCVAENNTQYGILELFSVVRDFKFGGTANPTILRGNGKVGIKSKELCTGHLDGVQIHDNKHGIHFSRSCTGNGSDAQIYRNQYGVTLRNQSSFVNLRIDWKFGTADVNTVTPWDVEANSSFVSNENEAITGVFTGRGEKLMGSFAPDPAFTLTGSTAVTTISNLGTLLRGSLARPGGYVKARIMGSKGGTSGTATIDFRFGGSTAGTIVVPANGVFFDIEVLIFSKGQGKQTVFAKDSLSGAPAQRVDRTYDVNLADYLLSARATLASATDSLVVNGAWVYTTEALAAES